MTDSTSKPPADDNSKAPDPFDPKNLRLSQDFAETGGVKKVLTVVPCRKPRRQEFVRVRPGEDWQMPTAILEDEATRDAYVVCPQLHAYLADEVKPVLLFVAISKRGDVFLWPVKLPGQDGRSNPWNDSSLAAAKLAQSKWVRVTSNMAAGCYDVFEATGNFSDPEWPDDQMPDLLRLCFKDRFIDRLDHPLLKQLRGEP